MMLLMSRAAKREVYIQMRLLYSSQEKCPSIIFAVLGKSRLVSNSDVRAKGQSILVALNLVVMLVAGALHRSLQPTAAIVLGRVRIRIVTSLFTWVPIIERPVMTAVKVIGEESSQSRT